MGKGVEAHAFHLPKGSQIILSQRPPKQRERYLTHVVELVNEGSEDKPQWEIGVWGIFRWVKIHWIADFSHISGIPLDKHVMKVNWGWQDTKAKSLNSPGLSTYSNQSVFRKILSYQIYWHEQNCRYQWKLPLLVRA
ncbi:MAG: hypothetical protein PUP92_15625 [Rhizonema sp. PD38]|nr:hypothetical protein [Rhizonema sp. PD38]